MTTTIVRPGETQEAALRRLERHPNYVRILETERGQSLLRDVARRASAARREVRA